MAMGACVTDPGGQLACKIRLSTITTALTAVFLIFSFLTLAEGKPLSNYAARQMHPGLNGAIDPKLPYTPPSKRQTNCDCYQTNDGTLYSNYILQDYRPYVPPAGGSAPNVTTTAPMQVTNEFFASTGFAKDFQISEYSHPASDGHPIEDSFSKGNVFLGRDNASSPGYIVLRTQRTPDFQTSAEVASNFKIMYGSARVMARIGGAAGAVASTFLYANDDCESDTEIMTGGPTNIFHATNQPSTRNRVAVSGATNIVNSTASFMNFNVWGMDWSAEKGVVWSMNGNPVESKTVNNPNEPMTFLMNIWSDGGSWSGEMAEGQSAWMQVQYFHLAYNTTTSNSCTGKSICPVPDV